MAAHTGDGVVRADDVRLGISIPGTVGLAGRSLDWALALCVDMGIAVVELSGNTLDSILGVPVPTVPLEPPPADGVEFGLLELEEDVLRDSYELAKQTFDAQLRAWRTTASLSPLERLRRSCQNAGISIDVASVPDLVRWSDDEVDYACRAARAVGARVLATRASLAGPRRLAPVARRHGVGLSFTGDAPTGADELGRILEFDDHIAVSVDLGTWTAAGQGSLLAFLDQHAPRVSHVRLRHLPRDGTAITSGSGDAPVRDVLRAMRDHSWGFPAIIVVDPMPDDDDWHADVTQALAYCRTSLE
jgi:sugar phosphate isomerase/epimerase